MSLEGVFSDVPDVTSIVRSSSRNACFLSLISLLDSIYISCDPGLIFLLFFPFSLLLLSWQHKKKKVLDWLLCLDSLFKQLSVHVFSTSSQDQREERRSHEKHLQTLRQLCTCSSCKKNARLEDEGVKQSNVRSITVMKENLSHSHSLISPEFTVYSLLSLRCCLVSSLLIPLCFAIQKEVQDKKIGRSQWHVSCESKTARPRLWEQEFNRINHRNDSSEQERHAKQRTLTGNLIALMLHLIPSPAYYSLSRAQRRPKGQESCLDAAADVLVSKNCFPSFRQKRDDDITSSFTVLSPLLLVPFLSVSWMCLSLSLSLSFVTLGL